MKSRLLKWLFAAPVAAGSVCLTMQLTNQANTPLNSVGNLELENAPKVDEKLLEPTVPPQSAPPPAPPPPPPPEPSSSSSSSPDQKSSEGTTTTDKTQSSQSPRSSESEMQLEEALKKRIEEIKFKVPTWTGSGGSFTTSYEVIDRFSGLSLLLEQLAKKIQEATQQQADS